MNQGCVNLSTQVDKDEVMQMIENLAGVETRESFNQMISTTQDIDIESFYKRAGFKFEYEENQKSDAGFIARFEGKQVFVKEVVLDSSAYSSGVNAGDEIISINDQRFFKSDMDKFSDYFYSGKSYKLLVSRLSKLVELDYIPGTQTRSLKKISLIDESKYLKFLKSW